MAPKISKAQNSDRSILAKFTLTKGMKNNKDVSKELIDAGAYTAFYTKKNNDSIYMANVFANHNSESIGSIYNIIIRQKRKKSETAHGGVIVAFDWYYQDSYEDDQGTAKIEAIIVQDKPEGNSFSLRLLSQDNQFLEYEGKVDGIINDRLFDLLTERENNPGN
jgi:hypothetical protein